MTEIRWAVQVTHWSHGKKLDPFLAGRYYFDRYAKNLAANRMLQGDQRQVLQCADQRDDMAATATFDTREAARQRCQLIRGGAHHWRCTARPVRVRVHVEVLEVDLPCRMATGGASDAYAAALPGPREIP